VVVYNSIAMDFPGYTIVYITTATATVQLPIVKHGYYATFEGAASNIHISDIQKMSFDKTV